MAQSRLVARALESAHPGLTVELVGLDTRGDANPDKPLHALDGKEVFVGELDAALRRGAVDCTVHSLKDLSTDRPADLVTAAVPKRADPRDVVVFGPRAETKLKAGKPLRVGSGAPRRQENVPGFLSRALPRWGTAPSVEMVDLRGNVDSRLARVSLPDDDPKALDAVVLAVAGVSRLFSDADGHRKAAPLLAGTRFMVLPLRECPSAPGQGALAVECRADDARTRELLSVLDDPATRGEVDDERAELVAAGGGCHQAFGATSITHANLGRMRFVNGRDDSGHALTGVRWNAPPKPSGKVIAWDGTQATQDPPMPIRAGIPSISNRPVFVAHKRAVPDVSVLSGASVWVAGTSTWTALASQGVWVEGSVEGLGFESSLASRPAFLGSTGNWLYFTHADTSLATPHAEIVATYSPGRWRAEASIDRATHVYWTSPTQVSLAPKHPVVHCCGPGRTADVLRARGLEPLVFPSIEEWRRWLSA